MRLIRDAAQDADIERAVAQAVGKGKMTLQDGCLLLGLAAVTALDANVGRAGADARGLEEAAGSPGQRRGRGVWFPPALDRERAASGL